jgi:proteasome accessory factor C
MSISAAPAEARLRRLLAMVPWIVANDGPNVADVLSRFGGTEDELRRDLELLFLCGVHPFTPADLIDAEIADGRVWIRYADWFRRPLRLTPSEGLTVIAAANALLDQPGAEPDGALATGLAKLCAAMGIEADEIIDVDLGESEPEATRQLREAIAHNQVVRIRYYSYGRDAIGERLVEPHHLFGSSGAWYLQAWCRKAVGERLFRIDRIDDLLVTDEPFEPRPIRERNVFAPDKSAPSITLVLSEEAAWVGEQYPHTRLELQPNGERIVTLTVTEQAWIDRLLVRLGPLVRVVEGAAHPEQAAKRILGRYNSAPNTAVAR